MLYIFVEGPDDEKFLEKFLPKKNGICNYIQYAKLPIKKINAFLKSLACIPNTEYLFFVDEDGKTIEVVMENVLHTYTDLKSDNLFVVQYEIESWYYAGINEGQCKQLKMKHFQYDTNTLTKEQFNAKMLRSSERQYIMSEILKLFSCALAVDRNDSFNYWYYKIGENSAMLFSEYQVTAN